MTFGKDLTMGLVAGGITMNRGVGTLIPPSDFWGGERDRGLTQSPISNELINHEASMKIQKDRVQRTSTLGNKDAPMGHLKGPPPLQGQKCHVRDPALCVPPGCYLGPFNIV